MIFDCVAIILRKCIGIELHRRTDLVAMVALILSVLTAAASLSYFILALMIGAKVDIYLYDQVLITHEPFTKNGVEHLRIGATLAFVNSGEIGYDATVKTVKTILNFSDDTSYEQRWAYFVTFFNENGEIKKGPSQAAVPTQIIGGSSISRDIYFAPFRIRCTSGENDCNEWRNYLTWSDFIRHIERLNIGSEIEIIVTASFMAQDDVAAQCSIHVDEHLIKRLKDSGWHSPSCWPND